jgi:hypothetical protein
MPYTRGSAVAVDSDARKATTTISVRLTPTVREEVMMLGENEETFKECHKKEKKKKKKKQRGKLKSVCVRVQESSRERERVQEREKKELKKW